MRCEYGYVDYFFLFTFGFFTEFCYFPELEMNTAAREKKFEFYTNFEKIWPTMQSKALDELILNMLFIKFFTVVLCSKPLNRIIFFKKYHI